MSAGEVPGAQPVRDEDSFDAKAMDDWLRERVDDLGGGLPEIRQFVGGASNLTYLLRYPDRDLILRRPPAGHKAASAHDMRREYRVQDSLRPVFPYVPRMLAFCDDPAVMGADFYVMERLNGLILRGDLPEGMTLSPEEARALSTRVVDRLVELHQVDPAAAGLSDLGRGPGYPARQVRGWSDRYRRARTPNVPDFERTMAWLDEHTPDDVRTCVIHNDYRFDNLVLAPDDIQRIIGILDWEMATLGDPLMELGGALAYWVQADDHPFDLMRRNQPTHLPGMLTRREVVEYYCDRMGLPTENWAFYEVFGGFRLAGIVQQIYYRFHHGQTTNPRFAEYWRFVEHLDARCTRLIEQSSR